jgi:predicted ABC-type ATPase
VHRAQAKGYRVTLLFFWLRSPELAMQRVAERVSKGGHDIPVDIIRRRYVSGINNLFNLYATEVDYWAVFDNSDNPRTMVAKGGNNRVTVVLNEGLYTKLQRLCQNKK